MLRLTKLTDYGIVIMTCLAGRPTQPQAAVQIAECTHVAPPTVSKVLKRLNQAGLVDSTRGSKGGYRLARPATLITVADVVAALEGPVSITECSTSDGNCDQEDFCSLKGNWGRINAAIREALEGITLAEMSGGSVPVQLSGMAVRAV